ncbi:EAL domain-containing protein [Aliivibrio fischeri]|uniref:Diguanylate phosphodiesterase n=1 Tax=Aliivibrio fischeri TaxID=668 RepID=A0A510UI02_ALIFS|nr:EAL domain-containing protein [Aliivibrio fischeri]MUK50578.1 EAL domain-containing protein [Aliivibrio fischeri]GEK14258.1 diguanylate phosphodiesterase [Aliivibrio fischeri]
MKTITLVALTNWPLIIELFGYSYCKDLWKELIINITSKNKFILHDEKHKSNEIYFLNEGNNIKKIHLSIKTSITIFLQDKLGILTFRLAKIELSTIEYKKNYNFTYRDLNKLYSSPHGELKKIMEEKQITPFLQGIYGSEKKELIGYEALSRGPINSSLFQANNLFSAALSQNVMHELELICLEQILDLTKHIDDDRFLSINLSPYMLLDKSVYILLNKVEDKSKIKLELTEHTFIPCWKKIISAMNKYRTLGFEFWLDDVGCGYFDYETIKIVNPELTKIGISLIKNIINDDEIIEKLKLITNEIHNTGGKILAEGVENLEQVELIRKINIDYIQGYYFDVPGEALNKLNNY